MKSHIFTVPPPYTKIPVTMSFKAGDSKDVVKNTVSQIIESNELKKSGMVTEKFELKNDTDINFDVISKSGEQYPPQFYSELSEPQQVVVKKIFTGVRNGKQYPVINGAFGDLPDCSGIVEDRVQGPNGEPLTKIFGCSLLFKGYPEEGAVESMRVSKSLVSSIPREILNRSLFFKIYIAILFLISRRRFFHYVRVYVNNIYLGIEKSIKEYGKLERELKRSMDSVLNWLLKKDSISVSSLLVRNHNIRYSKKTELCLIVANVMEFLYFLISMDTAYRFRLQDILVEVDRSAGYENPRKEINRLFEILILRENSPLQREKYKLVRKVVSLCLKFSKTLRKIASEFFGCISMPQVYMDESDKYFSLRRAQYNFGGKKLEERLEEAEKIDKEAGNMRISLVILQDEKGQKFNGIKVIV